MAGMKQALARWLFDQIHSRNLIYNQCWEDPALDNAVLRLTPEDRVVMITSAGCNALDYLLQAPAHIQCVDMNPHQNALLELKLAAIESLPYDQFFQMFGSGRVHEHRRIYLEHLRRRLTSLTQNIWDRKIDYFDPDGVGLYYRGTAGFFARSLCFYLNTCRGLRKELDEFQRIQNLEQQSAFYRERISPKLWSPFVRFLIRRPVVLSLLGVPVEQTWQMCRGTSSNVSSFIEERVAKALTTVPIAQNYFWRVYMNGRYPAGCCPKYLERGNFEILRERISRIQIKTATLTEYLLSTRERFSVFVLLDHMDWLSDMPDLLEQEWRSIMGAALPDTRIIYRSGSLTCDYLPEFVLRHLQFQPERTEELHTRDRVGTYTSFHFAKVTL
jgi:S-adenosylmethionine-diacylglycerol 3-amino-3-carboxypropyl transferase